MTNECKVRDEDKITILGEHDPTTEDYTVCYVQGSDLVFSTSSDIVPLNLDTPQWNYYNGATWSLEDLQSGHYMSVWQIAIPTAADNFSKPYRFIWIVGESEGTKLEQQRLTTENIFGSLETLSPEFVAINKVIIGNIDGEWQIIEVDEIYGTQKSQLKKSSLIRSFQVTNTYRVSPVGGDFSDLNEMFDHFYGDTTRTDGVRVIIDAGEYYVTDTIIVDYNFPIFLEGSGVNATIIKADPLLYNAAEPDVDLKSKPLFRIKSSINFNKVMLDGSDAGDWWLYPGARMICIDSGSDDIYIECRDFVMYQAARGICTEASIEVFAFDFIIEKMSQVGIGISTLSTGGAIDLEIGNFVNCAYCINLNQGQDVNIFLFGLRCFNEVGQTFINYNPTLFSYIAWVCDGIDWNNVGSFISGVDYTLERDSNISIKNVNNYADNSPYAYINVENGASTTLCVTTGNWYDANYIISASEVIKTEIVSVGTNHSIKGLSDYVFDFIAHCGFNIAASSNNRTLYVGIFKNSDITPLVTFKTRLITAGISQNLAGSVKVISFTKNDTIKVKYRCPSNTNTTFTTEDINIIFTVLK